MCKVCRTEFDVVPARVGTAKFCSHSCYGIWRKTALQGINNPNWKGGIGSPIKTCPYCKKDFEHDGITPKSVWEKRKFCSKDCADKGGFRYTGEANWKWNSDPNKKRHRGNSHYKWADAVFTRDQNTCQKCGANNIEIHAHHLKSYKDNPELRYDVTSGITLCYSCHWDVHSVQNEKAENSVKPLTVMVSQNGNTEPSLNRKVFEGVTTRGRACRRVLGKCNWCGEFVSKRLSDVKPSGLMFCTKNCAGKYLAATRTYRQWKNPDYGSNFLHENRPRKG